MSYDLVRFSSGSYSYFSKNIFKNLENIDKFSTDLGKEYFALKISPPAIHEKSAVLTH